MFFFPLLRTASTLLGQKETKNPLKNLLAQKLKNSNFTSFLYHKTISHGGCLSKIILYTSYLVGAGTDRPKIITKNNYHNATTEKEKE